MSGQRAVARLRLPTFVGIGAQKCASTWLHHVLAGHPEVFVPPAKELDFFSHRYDRGVLWYARQFETPDRAVLARGEISPSYFHEPAVPARVARHLPDARILVCLRDPVERALSNHRHEVRVGHVTGDDLSFEHALSANPMYVEQGLYATHLRRWLQHFPRAQVLVVLTDDVAHDSAAVGRQVFQFLGVDAGFVAPGTAEPRNESYVSRSQRLAVLKDALYAATRQPGLRQAWDAAAALGLRSAYRRFNRAASTAVIPEPAPETLLVLRRRFEPEIRELEHLLGRSLSQWLGGATARKAVA